MGLCRVDKFRIVLVKVRGGNMAYKVDIHKTFDTLSWKFLLLVLTHFGFHPSFAGWICIILRSAMFFYHNK